MPSIKVNETLAANGVASLLAGSVFEYLPWDARVDIALVVGAGESVSATIYSGSDVVLQDGPLDEKAATDPITTFDFQFQDVAAAGERLSIPVRETGGAAATVRGLIRLTPLR